MRLHIIALLALFSVASSCFGAATVTGTIVDRNNRPSTNTLIKFTGIARPTFGTGEVRPGWTIRTNSDTSGNFSLVLLAGSYRVEIANDNLDTFTIVVPASGTYSIDALATNVIATPSYNMPPTNWVMKPASSLTNGYLGFVPTPTNGQQAAFLRGDGTWQIVSGAGTVTSVAVTNSGDGLTSSGGPVTSDGTITLALSTNLQGWSAIPTNQLTAAGQPASSNLTNWATVATNLVAYTSQLGTAAYSNSASFQPSGTYAEPSITNGLAHTNWLPVVIAGTNATVVTNIVNGQARYTVSSTASGSGGGSTFNPNQFDTNGSSQVQIKSSATVTNLDATDPTLKFVVAGGTINMQAGSEGISVVKGVTEYANFNETNSYFVNPLFVSTPTVDGHATTKLYVDTAITNATNGLSAGSFSTNQPHLTITNNITYAVNTNAAGTATVFYLDMTKAMQELRITNVGLAGVTFHTTNRAAGLTTMLRVRQTATNSLPLTFNSGWTNFVGAPPPTALATNVWAILSLSCWGGDETNVLAGYAVQPY